MNLLASEHAVAVNRGYDTCFRKRLVMGYVDCSVADPVELRRVVHHSIDLGET